MLIRIPDDTPMYQLEYLAEKINCDLVVDVDSRPEFVKREHRVPPMANVVEFTGKRKPRRLVNRTRPDGPGAA